MDKFVMKSSETVRTPSAEKSSKRKPKDDEYDKAYDAKNRQRVFQTIWLKEFSRLPMGYERGVVKCKVCC